MKATYIRVFFTTMVFPVQPLFMAYKSLILSSSSISSLLIVHFFFSRHSTTYLLISLHTQSHEDWAWSTVLSLHFLQMAGEGPGMSPS